jgi:hypothetical protein
MQTNNASDLSKLSRTHEDKYRGAVIVETDTRQVGMRVNSICGFFIAREDELYVSRKVYIGK